MPKTPFRPEVDGFAFCNCWQLQGNELDQVRDTLVGLVHVAIPTFINPRLPIPIPTGLAEQALRKWIANLDPAPIGLCGGMAFASLDYWRKGWLVPRGFGPDDQPTVQTREGAELREYLWRRLLESLRDNGGRLLGWMAVGQLLPDLIGGQDKLKDWSRSEFDRLKAHIDQGEPWPIMLIGSTNDPSQNHQVLAYGYEEFDVEHRRIYVYDNNCPDQENTIDLDFSGKVLEAVLTCTTSITLRGFFCNEYTEATPPVALGLVSSLTVSPGQVAAGEAAHFQFSARNAGFGNTPELELGVTGPLNAFLVLDGTPCLITQGAARSVDLSGAVTGPAGPAEVHAVCRLRLPDGSQVEKQLPPLEDDISARALLQVAGDTEAALFGTRGGGTLSSPN